MRRLQQQLQRKMKKCERRLVASLIFIILHETKGSTVKVDSFEIHFCVLTQIECAVCMLLLLQGFCLCEQRAHATRVLYYYKTFETEANESHKTEKRY